MSDHKHTPGPWEVKNFTDVFTTLGAKTRGGVEAASNDGWQIADCSIGVTFDVDGQERTLQPSEQYANARLIASAPALLEALEAVVEANRMRADLADLQNMPRAGWYNKAQAALKLARGE